MKVDDSYQNTDLINSAKEALPNRDVKQENDHAERLEQGRSSGTRVEFSETSVEYSRAAEEMEKESVERARKVGEIEGRIKQGNYRVDADQVAGKILKDILTDLAG